VNDSQKIETYLREAMERFITDPPDDEYQQGFLGALMVIYEEALGMPKDSNILVAVKELG
jgi:hypothetical protein